MIKVVTKSKQIRDYVAANPKATPHDIADAMSVKVAYVYTVLWHAKRKAAKVKAAKKADAQWRNIAIVTSNTSFVKDIAGSVTQGENKVAGYGQRMSELAYQAGKGRQRVLAVEMMEPESDAVNHPAHYKVGGIETIDFIEAKKLNYRLGNVVKYLTRADYKGNKIEDLRKAQWYLEREIESLS